MISSSYCSASSFSGSSATVAPRPLPQRILPVEVVASHGSVVSVALASYSMTDVVVAVVRRIPRCLDEAKKE